MHQFTVECSTLTRWMTPRLGRAFEIIYDHERPEYVSSPSSDSLEKAYEIMHLANHNLETAARTVDGIPILEELVLTHIAPHLPNGNGAYAALVPLAQGDLQGALDLLGMHLALVR